MRRYSAIALSLTLILQVAPLTAAPHGRGARGRVQAAAATGAITGTARSGDGQTLPNYRVQLRDLQTGKLARTSTSNDEGSFAFADLRPASYAVEMVQAPGEIIGSNVAMPVVAGATVEITVSAPAARLTPVTAAAGASAAAVTKAAVLAGITAVADDGRPHASPSR